MADEKPLLHSRVMTTSKKEKSLRQYEDFKANGEIVSAVVVGADAEGNVTVIGQGMDLHEIGLSLYAAVKGVASALDNQKARLGDTKLDPGSMPEAHERPDIKVQYGKKRVPEMKQELDGKLTAPAGEEFVSCAECGCSKWFTLQYANSMRLSRFACVACGNEVKMVFASGSESMQ